MLPTNVMSFMKKVRMYFIVFVLSNCFRFNENAVVINSSSERYYFYLFIIIDEKAWNNDWHKANQNSVPVSDNIDFIRIQGNAFRWYTQRRKSFLSSTQWNSFKLHRFQLRHKLTASIYTKAVQFIRKWWSIFKDLKNFYTPFNVMHCLLIYIHKTLHDL